MTLEREDIEVGKSYINEIGTIVTVVYIENGYGFVHYYHNEDNKRLSIPRGIPSFCKKFSKYGW